MFSKFFQKLANFFINLYQNFFEIKIAQNEFFNELVILHMHGRAPTHMVYFKLIYCFRKLERKAHSGGVTPFSKRITRIQGKQHRILIHNFLRYD